MRDRVRRIAALGTSVVLTAGLLQLSGVGAEARSPRDSSTGAATTQSSASATANVDKVPTPKLGWFECTTDGFQCATVKVPRDYDQPNGAKVELAIGKRAAAKPSQRLGTLFVNPGGPGGSAVDLALYAQYIFSPAILDRFDIVGLDPRGVGYSDNVRCFPSFRAQVEAYRGYTSSFPVTSAEEKAWLASDKLVGAACSGNTLAKSMSTAEDARDLELMRRAVGDAKLSYLGFSYGTYLGQTYANLFPNRFRAIAVDGVLDPVNWAGDSANQDQPLEFRLRSSVGAWKAMREILKRCDAAGGEKCSFAPGDPVANFALIAQRLKAKPVDDLGYADFVGLMLGLLYSPDGYQPITEVLTELYVLTEPPSAGVSAARRSDARTRFAALYATYKDRIQRPTRDFPYYSGLEAFASVTCTDSKETTKASLYPAYAAQADEIAPYFGRAWLWGSSLCAGDTFTGNDEDVYSGPFNKRTGATVLFVGDYYDPATNYDDAVSAAKRMPNARLLSSNSWGHTAYGTSDCVTNAMDAYLLKGTLPKVGKVCVGDVQPYAADEEQLAAAAARTAILQKAREGGHLQFR